VCCQVIHSLGIVLFHALDFGLSEAEEQLLSEQLGELIERMTNVNQPASDEHDGTDEGIVDDGGFDKESLSGNETPRQLTLQEIIRVISLTCMFSLTYVIA
jgi:Kinase non-catalytic C-lobe domain